MSEADARRAADTRDADTSDIPPALTPTEWANVKRYRLDLLKFVEFAERTGRHHAMLALLNDDLHDEDVRKITREHVELLRSAAKTAEIAQGEGQGQADFEAYGELHSQLLEFADVIESYLPPADEAKR